MVAIVADRWDGPEVGAARLVPAFSEMRDRLAGRFEWGGDALDDLFLLLFKARPEVAAPEAVEPGYRVVRVLVALLAENLVVQRLRASTSRDTVAAAQGAVALAPALSEALDSLADSGVGETADEDELIDGVAAQVDLDGLEAAATDTALRHEQMASAAEAWGLSTPGALQQLPLAERLALADQLDTDAMRKVTELFGRLRVSMFGREAPAAGPGSEPVEVELGDDLSRLVGSELLSLEVDQLFFARVAEGSLAQYRMEGVDRLGRGGIVLCVDCSFSMSLEHQGYTREMWATALKLFLLRTALSEERPMHVINFSGPGDVDHHRFVEPAERTLEAALASARNWYGYGTDFVGPLHTAMDVLLDDGLRGADVVFVSDGECTVSRAMVQRYGRVTRPRGIRTWGVQVGRKPGALPQFCDQVIPITDLTSGRQLGDLLSAISAV